MAEKILIADDDVDTLKLIGLMLQRQGYEVRAANSGNQALTKAKAERPHLIILDIMMPDMDGLEVCRRLRADESTANIPIIMFTAKTLIDDKVKGFEAGADDYVTKPTHPAELASRVKAVLARKAAAQQETVRSSQRRSLSIGFLGAKGGVGTTTMAVNMAAALLKGSEQPLLADFDLGSGTIGLSLGTTVHSMSTVLTKQNITEQLIEDALITHQSGLRAIISSADPKESQLDYSYDAAVKTAQIINSIGNPAVFDLGHGLTPLNTQLIPLLDRLMLVIEPTPICLQLAENLVNELESIIDPNRVSIVVVSRATTNHKIPWLEIENTLGHEVKAMISAAPDLLIQSMQKATPIVLFQPGAIVSMQIIKIAEELKAQIRANANKQLSS